MGIIKRVGFLRLGVIGLLLLVGALLALWAWLMQPVTGPVAITVTHGPWSEICQVPYYTVRNDDQIPFQLDRVSFAYDSGQRFPLPERPLAPGASVRVWSGGGESNADDIYLGRTEQEWQVNGFRAVLDGKTHIFSTISCDPPFNIPK